LEINNRVRAAERRLPEVVRTYGVNVRKRSEETLLSVALSSPDHSMEAIQLADYANLNMVDELKRLPGIGDVAVVGNTQSAMRIWLDPEKMGMLGIAVKDVEDAVKEQNAQKTAGSLGGSPATDDQQLTYRMTAQGQLLTPEQFGNIILRSDGPEGVVHLKDIARTEVGKRSYGMRVDINGEPGVNINIYLQTGANAMAAAQAVKERLAEMKKHFPQGRIDYTINDDTTVFVGAALHEVYQTLAEAGLLVLAVVFLFLQSWRATLIPMLAVPVSLIGTFAGLWLFGFSMNTLTLFAMVLAIGIVVDDAIVVLENVERLMVREGLGAFDASVKAMQEVSGALVAIVLVLCAVFIPVAFLGGIAGELYRQFAVTVATSVVLSGFVALTLTPALCAILLKSPASGEQKFIGFRLFNKGLEHFTNGFLFMVRLSLRHRILSGLGLILVTLTGWQMLVTTPTSFIPKEDQGVVRVSIQLPEAAAFPRTDAVGVELLEKFRRIEGVKTVVTMLGYDTMSNDRRSNAATFILQLKPWDERVSSADDIRRRIQKILAEHPDLKGSASLPASIRGLGSASGFSGYVLARGNDNPLVLQEAMDAFFQALSERSELTSLRSYLNADTPQYHLRVDEEKAAAMGVSLDDLFTTVSHLTDSKYVNDFTRNGKIYRVVVQADAPFRMGPDNLDRMYVRSSSTKRMIPVGSLVTVERTSGASSLARMNGYLAAQFSGQAVLGVSSGDAIRIVEEVAEEVLPEGFTVAWTGQAYHEKRIGSSSVTAVSFGL
ncbi:MAG: efflux RND transporter permease subunit, partial [Sutterella sp.]